jgi:hypothetical protein
MLLLPRRETVFALHSVSHAANDSLFEVERGAVAVAHRLCLVSRVHGEGSVLGGNHFGDSSAVV